MTNTEALLNRARTDVGIIDGYKQKPYPTRADWDAHYRAVENLRAYGPDFARVVLEQAEKLARLTSQ